MNATEWIAFETWNEKFSSQLYRTVRIALRDIRTDFYHLLHHVKNILNDSINLLSLFWSREKCEFHFYRLRNARQVFENIKISTFCSIEEKKALLSRHDACLRLR